MKWEASLLQRENLDQVVDLACACFDDVDRDLVEKDFGLIFTDYPYRPKAFVARDGDRLIGVLQSLPAYISGDTQAFAWLGVHPDYRRRGVGRALLAHAEADAIEHSFQGSPGTFLLRSDCPPEFYFKIGYRGCGEVATHDGHPFLIKHFKPIQ